MPTGRDRSTRLKALEDDIEERDLKNGHTSDTDRSSRRRFSGTNEEATIKANSPRSMSSKSAQCSPARLPKTSQSPVASDMSRSEHEEVVGGQVTVKLEPGQPPKLARSSSQKIRTKPAQLFDDYPSKTEEAQSKFDVIPACIYGSKYMGSTEHGMDCDCTEEWGKLAHISHSTMYIFICSYMMQIALQKPTQHAAKIRIASTVRRRSSVQGIAGAAPSARTNAFNTANMPMSQSSRQKRKDTAYEQILT